MNNDDICIHCKRTLEYHIDGRCFGFKSISQHYAEQRGPENLKVMIELYEYVNGSKPIHITPSGADYKCYVPGSVINKLKAAIEASKPPKE